MSETSTQQASVDITTKTLIQLITDLISELNPGQALSQTIKLDSAFGHDLGMDSLARVELFTRVESEFCINLPEQAFAEVETARDLLRTIARAQGSTAKFSSTDINALAMGEGQAAPGSAQTLVDVLHWHVATHPDRPHAHFYREDKAAKLISYRTLLSGSQKMAAGLQAKGLQQGQAVTIMLLTGVDYFYSFFGILLAGGIPVPIYPPVRKSQLEDHLRRQVNILNNCQAMILITLEEAKLVAQLLKSHIDSLHSVVTAEELTQHATEFTPVKVSANDIAFLQYTSGSTGTPKGVILTHANLLNNIRIDGAALEVTPDDIFVSWLPLYHDMGLIGAWLGSLYFSVLLIIMSPLTFLGRPQRWLWAIDRFKGTLSAAPNFAYELCLSKIKDDDIKDLDLSSWRVALNGAESVSPKTISGFMERFKPYGFREETMFPVYGLAENAVGLSFPDLNQAPMIDRIQRLPLMQSGIAIPLENNKQKSLDFVSSGHALPGHQIRIVNLMGHELPERHQGRLQFFGPSSTSGYYRNPEKTHELFQDEWLESGDLAYMVGKDVYITGRIKDMIIHGGRNIYPEELELATGNIEGIRKGRVAVFGSQDEEKGTERLVVMAETKSTEENVVNKLRAEVIATINDVIGEPPDEVVIAPPGTILKTSSGKIRRTASRDLYLHGEIGIAERAVWQQIASLFLTSLGPQMRRIYLNLKARAYSFYCWLVFILSGLFNWLLIVIVPWYSWRWRIARKFPQAWAWLTGIPITVKGLENIPNENESCIFVVNHSSYLDSYLLTAVIPHAFSYIAKKELTGFWPLKIYLNKIKTIFVDSFDRKQSLADAEQAIDMARAGQSLLFFPEGTCQRMSGLLPFRMGAFLTAVESGLPVVPVAIRGTRLILRPDSWFVHPGSIGVVIGKAVNIQPGDDNWAKAIRLRDEAREHILRYCGEADLSNEKVEILFSDGVSE
ncbi:MAG: AMP-binding protein [gamma proteobacterium symbiont of Bathyaustriella thionipta]|nr:AMP-binding protein [gamma proteobacterium symbiont of Bathyaustriella thionipta]